MIYFFKFYPIIGAVFFIVALLFTFLPEKTTGNKNEYVSYVLWDLSVLWIINRVIRLVDIGQEYPTIATAVCVFPVSAFIYYIYPFEGERNKTVSFLLSCLAIIEMVGIPLGLILLSFM